MLFLINLSILAFCLFGFSFRLIKGKINFSVNLMKYIKYSYKFIL